MRITYEKPKVADYGTLQELTESCSNASGGDEASKHHVNVPTLVSKHNTFGCGSP